MSLRERTDETELLPITDNHFIQFSRPPSMVNWWAALAYWCSGLTQQLHVLMTLSDRRTVTRHPHYNNEDQAEQINPVITGLDWCETGTVWLQASRPQRSADTTCGQQAEHENKDGDIQGSRKANQTPSGRDASRRHVSGIFRLQTSQAVSNKSDSEVTNEDENL